MPLGSFRLNTLSAAPASAPTNDAPTIPSLTFTRREFASIGYAPSSLTPSKALTYVGTNNGRAFFANVGYNQTTTTAIYNQVISTDWVSTSPSISYSSVATATNGGAHSAISSPGINGTTGGQFLSVINGTNSTNDIRTRTGTITNWAAGTATGTNTGGTLSTAQTRTSAYSNPTVSISHSPYTVTPSTHRILLAYHTVVSSTNYIAIATGTQNSGSTTATFGITLVSNTQIASSTTAGSGNCIDTCGFSTSSSTETRFGVGYTIGTTSYVVRATKILSNVAYTTAVTPYSGSAITYATLATLWDDVANNKSVAVSCVSISGNTYLRSIRITNWNGGTTTAPVVSLGTQVAIGSQLPYATITKINGQGLGILTYLNSTSNRYFARFISVDSSTGDITVGSQFDLDGSNSSNIVSKFGVACGLSPSNELILGIQGIGSSWRYNVYKSNQII